MAKRSIPRKKGDSFAGQQVAVAYNRHECLVSHPKKAGEHCFPVREKASSSSKVLAYVDELWLENVKFFVSPSGMRRIKETGVRTVCCFVVGSVLKAKPRSVTSKNGWGRIHLSVDEGGFVRARGGDLVRSAKYAYLGGREIRAFGARKGEPYTSLREVNPGPTRLPTYGPRRAEWRGEMGGRNFQAASPVEVVEAIRWTLMRYPGAYIVDGTDDWDAPLQARPAELVARYGLTPLAWWDTGVGGQTRSGVVLSPHQYAALAARFEQEFGEGLESFGTQPGQLARPECGCYGGEALRIYR